MSWGDVRDIFVIPLALGGILLFALKEYLRQTFRTTAEQQIFERDQYNPLAQAVHQLEAAVEVARLELEKQKLRLDEMDKYGSVASRSLIKMVNRMDKRIYRIALQAGVEDDETDVTEGS